MTATEADNLNLNQTIVDGLAKIEQAMLDVTNSEVDILRDASHHILSAGGKRIRPRLLLLSYLAVGGDNLSYIAKPAAAIELMHTASVVHDDINDHGVMRRGRPSVNSIWGRTFALLTGDFLFTAVYELMSSYKDLNADLAESATALVEGETLQASAVKENNFTREVYMRIIALKTAALFRAAGLMGGKLANATQAQIDALANFGFNIGLAFQIIDDILDIVGDDEQLGKTSGIDVEQGRGIGVALQNGTATMGKAYSMKSVKRKMMECDTIEKVRQRERQLFDMAIMGLSVIPDSIAKTELISLANLVINRDH